MNTFVLHTEHSEVFSAIHQVSTNLHQIFTNSIYYLGIQALECDYVINIPCKTLWILGNYCLTLFEIRK